MVPRLLFNFTRRSMHTTACATAVTRRLTSSIARSATCHETFHDARRHSSWRHLPSNLSCLDTCRFLRQWPPTRRRRQSCRRLHASSSARPTASCTTTSTTASRRVRHSTRQLLADTFHRRMSWCHSSEPHSPQSFKFKKLVAKHQACFTTKLQGQNLVTFSHSAVRTIAYLQHTNKTCINNALIMR